MQILMHEKQPKPFPGNKRKCVIMGEN